MIKRLFSAALAASVLMLPALRAQADVHALLGIAGGAIIACGVTGACGNGGGNRSTASTRSCGPQCQANVEAQRALAYFGYNPGGADGVWGQNSRRAASGFEAEMGFFPVDGQLNDMERGFLVSSYQRAQSGFYGPHQTAYATGGPRGLLVSFNDERLGRFQPTGTVTVTAPPATVVAPPTTTVVAPAPTVVAPAPTTTVVAPAPAAPAPAAPAFSGFTLASSMQSFCANAMQASPNVDVTLASAAMDQVMAQQFCLAMDATREDGMALRASIDGMTPDQVLAQCQGLTGVLQASVNALGAQPREGTEVAARGAMSGMPTDQAIAAGRICLSVGYDTDDAAMALAAALALSAQGEASYGELVGHHLREGFGISANPTAAQNWLLSTVDAIEAGASPAFLAAEASGRGAIIRAAYGSGSTVPDAVIDNATSGASLPTFTLSGN